MHKALLVPYDVARNKKLGDPVKAVGGRVRAATGQALTKFNVIPSAMNFSEAFLRVSFDTPNSYPNSTHYVYRFSDTADAMSLLSQATGDYIIHQDNYLSKTVPGSAWKNLWWPADSKTEPVIGNKHFPKCPYMHRAITEDDYKAGFSYLPKLALYIDPSVELVADSNVSVVACFLLQGLLNAFYFGNRYQNWEVHSPGFAQYEHLGPWWKEIFFRTNSNGLLHLSCPVNPWLLNDKTRVNHFYNVYLPELMKEANSLRTQTDFVSLFANFRDAGFSVPQSFTSAFMHACGSNKNQRRIMSLYGQLEDGALVGSYNGPTNPVTDHIEEVESFDDGAEEDTE